MAQRVALAREQMEDQLRRYVEGVNRHDVDLMMDLRHPDAHLELMGQGIRIDGREELRAYYRNLFAEVLPDYHLEVVGSAWGENTGVVWGRFSATVGRELMGSQARGGRVDVPVAFVCTFVERQFCGDQMYFDSGAFRRQAGIADDAVVRTGN